MGRYPLVAMYAVVETGGKQYRVEQGSTIEVERVARPGSEITLRPVMLVDGEAVAGYAGPTSPAPA